MWKLIKSFIPISFKKAILAILDNIAWLYREFPHIKHDLSLLTQSTIEKDLKQKIKKTLIRTFYFKNYSKKKKIADVVGNKMNFNYFMRIYHLFEEIFIGQPYYFNTNKSKPVIIDCGSHIGMSVVYFKTIYPNAKIICFEPDNYTCSILKNNIETNGLLDVEINNVAVMKFNGLTEFYTVENNKSDVAMSTIKERVKNEKKNTVKAKKLSQYINEEIDFLKIDIEGAEYGVLEELKSSGKLHYVKQAAIEFHHHIIENEDKFSRVLKLLESEGFGYQIESHFPPQHKLYKFQDILVCAYNKTYNL